MSRGSTLQRFFGAATVALCAAQAQADSAHSLYRVDGSTRPVLESLLQQGAIVSQRVGAVSLVFGDDRLPAMLEQLGCDYVVLDADARGRDYYLVPAAETDLHAAPEPLRLLDVVNGTAVVSTPRGDIDPVHALGVHAAKLFRTPMRLGPAEPRTWAPNRLASSRTLINELVSAVSPETLASHVLILEGFGTRNARKLGSHRAAAWIAGRFRSYGIEQVEIQTWTSLFAGNVVATLPGKASPDDIYVLGGHYDSIAFGEEFEPGADDNASGTATILECARLLAPHQFDATLVFIAFGAEEYGLIGSEDYASRAAARGQRILGMINLDMLGYRSHADRRDLDLISNKPSTWLSDAVHDAATSYVPDLPIVDGQLLAGNSDHASFWRHGFDAVFFHEDIGNSSPFIHTVNDIIGASYIDTELHRLCTQTALATLASLAGQTEVAVAVQSFSLQRLPDAVRLSWRLSEPTQAGLSGIAVQRARDTAGPYEERAARLAPGTRDFVDLVPATEEMWYRLWLQHSNGEHSFTRPVLAAAGRQRTSIVSVHTRGEDDLIEIRFSVAGNSNRTQLGIYDVRGRLVRALVDGSMNAGTYVQSWNRRDAEGRAVGRGVYLVHLRGANARATRKVTVHSR